MSTTDDDGRLERGRALAERHLGDGVVERWRAVSPPQPSVSHIVQVAASIAAAASTALPPFAKIMAPAVAASGLPVIATQCRPCSTGFTVRRD